MVVKATESLRFSRFLFYCAQTDSTWSSIPTRLCSPRAWLCFLLLGLYKSKVFLHFRLFILHKMYWARFSHYSVKGIQIIHFGSWQMRIWKYLIFFNHLYQRLPLYNSRQSFSLCSLKPFPILHMAQNLNIIRIYFEKINSLDPTMHLILNCPYIILTEKLACLSIILLVRGSSLQFGMPTLSSQRGLIYNKSSFQS